MCENEDANNDAEYWKSQRALMRLEGCVQLNNGSFGPIPSPVFERLIELQRQVAASPSDFYWRRQPELLQAARMALAEYLNADPRNLLLILNTTFGVNLAAASLELPRGSEILMTDQEYGACRYCWTEFANRRGWKIREAAIDKLPKTADATVDAIESAIGPDTRVLFFSHVTSPTGLVLPADRLCAAARRHNVLTVVDGAHAPAMAPVDLRRIDADFYAGNCHKWLLAPSGSAFLYVRSEQRSNLKPLVVSWGWDSPRDRPDEDSGWGGTHWQRYLEFQGTVDRCPQMCVPEAISLRQRIGESRIGRRVEQLVRMLRKEMSAMGFEPATPEDRNLSGTLTAFFVPQVDVVKARDWIFHEHGVEAPFTESAGRCHLRVSTSWFNNENDLDRLFEAMRKFDPAKLRRDG